MTEFKATKLPKNAELLQQLADSRLIGQPTDELTASLISISTHALQKTSYIHLTNKDEIVNDAIVVMLRTWDCFDPTKSSNPFAFFHTIAISAAIQYISREKREQRLKEDYAIVEQIARETE